METGPHLTENPWKFTFIRNIAFKCVNVFSSDNKKKERVLKTSCIRNHPGKTHTAQHFSIIKPSSCQRSGEAVIHLEKDKPACDGRVSIKLAM